MPILPKRGKGICRKKTPQKTRKLNKNDENREMVNTTQNRNNNNKKKKKGKKMEREGSGRL